MAAPSVASAQPSWDTPSSRGFELVPRSGGGASIGFWTAGRGDNRVDSLSGIVSAGIVLEEVLELGTNIGWSWANLDTVLTAPFGADAGSAGNPLIYARVVGGDRRWRLRGGLGATIPVIPRTGDSRLSAFFAATSRGLSNFWLWAPSRFTLVPEISLEAVPVDFLYLAASVHFGVMVELEGADIVPDLAASFGRAALAPHANDEDEALDVDLVVETMVAAGFRHDNVLAGLRARGVFLPTLPAEPAQSSLELFVRGNFPWPFEEDSAVELFGEARVVTNLNEPLGFGFDELGSWGVFFMIGASATPAQIPPGRYGVRSVSLRGTDHVDQLSILACLGTRARSRLSFDLGIPPRGTPECSEPPFDGGHAIIDPWSWPWTEWPLFDQTVFERDIERITRWYRARGFYDAEVTSTEVTPGEAMHSAQSSGEEEVEHCGNRPDSDCTVDVTFAVEEGEPVNIARMAIRFLDEDEEALPEDMRALLRATLRLERDHPFDEELYEETKRRMLRVLADHGYAHARVEGEVKINRRRREAFLIFKIEAGRPNVIGRVCVRGYENLPPDTILAVASLDPNEVFSLRGIEEAQHALYALGSFGGVEVTPDVAEAHAAIDAEGEHANVDSQPTEGEQRPVVTAEDVEVEVGDDEEPGFCSERPDEVREGYEPVDINIRVSPGRIDRFGAGIGFQAGDAVTLGSSGSYTSQQNAAQWDLHVSVAYEHRNLFDRLIRGRVEIRPRLIFEMPVFNFEPAQDIPLGIQTTLTFRWPAFLDRHMSLVFNARHDFGPMPITGFFRSELDGGLGPEVSLFDGHLYIRALLRGNWFFPTGRQPIEPTHRLPEIGALWLDETIRVDLRDDPRQPTEGVYFEVNAQQSVQPLSSWDLLRIVGEARGYVPLGAGIVLAGRFQMGAVEVLGASPDLEPDNVYRFDHLGPPALQLSGGGASSNRGYLPGLLGDGEQIYVTTPRSNDEIARGVPAGERPVRISGGTRSWLLSLEVRFPLTTDLGIVVFGDAGDVDRDRLDAPSPVTFRFDHPQISVGLGLRYRTIIGPIRLDFAIAPDELQVIGTDGSLPVTCTADRAYNCNPRNTMNFGFAQVPGAFHLTIGESF